MNPEETILAYRHNARQRKVPFDVLRVVEKQTWITDILLDIWKCSVHRLLPAVQTQTSQERQTTDQKVRKVQAKPVTAIYV